MRAATLVEGSPSRPCRQFRPIVLKWFHSSCHAENATLSLHSSQRGASYTRAGVARNALLGPSLAVGKVIHALPAMKQFPLANLRFVRGLRTRDRIVPASRLLIRSLLGISERVRMWTTVVGRTPLLESST